MTLLVAGPAPALEALTPLVEAHREGGREVVLCREPELTGPERLRALAADSGAEALLVVGDRRRSPRTVVPGPALEAGGRWIPVGWLPDAGAEAVAAFAEGAARVRRGAGEGGSASGTRTPEAERAPDSSSPVGTLLAAGTASPPSQRTGTSTVALLAQWEPRYLRLVERVRAGLEEGGGGPLLFTWSSDVVLREDLTRGLASGVGVALYLGHGRPIGWVGYRGFRAHHLPERPEHPLGLLFSLCCVTASRRRTSLSFSEAAVLRGSAAASIGAVTDTLHTQNGRLAVRVAAALRDGVRTVGALVARLLDPSPDALAHYRIVGDPLAPLCGTPGAAAAAARIPCFP